MIETRRAALAMAERLVSGLDVIQSIQELHKEGFDPDTVNEMMDYFARKFNSSPLEFQENIKETRNELVTMLTMLYKEEDGVV